MAENERHNAHSHQLAQAIASLAGDSQSRKQDYAVKRQHKHAADESFLLGNDGENEIIMSNRPRQITESILSPLAPSFSCQAPGPNRDQRLPHIVRVIELLLSQMFDLRF